MNLFVSVLTYALGKALGIPSAARAFSRMLIDETIDPRDVLPAARCVQRLRELGDLVIYHGAGTFVPKARTRAAHAALASDADVWIMIDDDVETDVATLRRLVTLALAVDGASVLPCAIRGSAEERHIINVVWDGSLVSLHDGVQARRVLRAGAGLMVITRPALQRAAARFHDQLAFLDDDRQTKVALFQPMLVGAPERLWFGEDYSFCERVRAADVAIFAPVAGISSHDGVVIDLDECARL